MARRRVSNPRRHQWHRSAGEFLGNYLAVDLFAQSRLAFDDATIGTACTVTVVKGYVRANAGGTDPSRGRAGIRVCDRNDIDDQDPQHGPSNPSVPQVAPNLGAWNDWMGYFPFIVEPGTVLSDATWNHAASPWAVDVQSARRIDELNQTLGLFLDGEAGTTQWYWDLSIGIRLGL